MKKRIQGITAAFLAVGSLGLTGCDEQDLQNTVRDLFTDTSQTYTIEPLPHESAVPPEPAPLPQKPPQDFKEGDLSIIAITPDQADNIVAGVIRYEGNRKDLFEKIKPGTCMSVQDSLTLRRYGTFCFKDVTTSIEIINNKAELNVCATYDADTNDQTVRERPKSADIINQTTCEIQPSPTILV